MGIITEDLKKLRAEDFDMEEKENQQSQLVALSHKIGPMRVIGVLLEWLPTAAIRDLNDFIIDFFSLGELKDEAIQAKLEKEAHPEIEEDLYFWEKEIPKLIDAQEPAQ